ncbi:MAG: hypothetical protein SFY70_12510 [Bacteroidia bacterium]|nr:hypothetical protein [Bacteroidia bacterium]
MFQWLRNRSGFLLGLALACGVVVYAALISQLPSGGADGENHYLFARYSWKYPHLLLSQWGKPVFTLLMSPFAQLGFEAVVAVNITITVLSAVLLYAWAARTHQPDAWLLLPLYVCAPAVLSSAISAMTEPLCALALVGVLLLMARKHYRWAAVLVSFTPYMRSEGFALILPVAAVLLLHRRWRDLPYLVVGVVVYGIVGALASGELFWFITDNPYVFKDKAHVYGSGPFLHYLERYRVIAGVPLGLLVVVGLLHRMVGLVRGWRNREVWSEWLLVEGSLIGFWLMHSFIWWRGMWGSLGLERVFTVVMPHAVWLAYQGWQVVRSTELRPWQRALVLQVPLVVWLARAPFADRVVPELVPYTDPELKKLITWMRQEGSYPERLLYNLPPKASIALGVDIYDPERFRTCFDLGPNAPSGAWYIWEAHFGPNECGTPLATLQQDSTLILRQEFHPAEPFTVLGNNPYAIYVFEKR